MASIEHFGSTSSSLAKKKNPGSSIEGKVTLKPAKDDEQPPFVTRFPSGYVPPSVLSESDGFSFQAYESVRPAKGGRNLLVMKTENIDFVGTSVTPDAQTKNPCRYLLGMRNKRTGELHLTPIAANKILRMEPRVRGVSYGRASLEEEREVGSEDAAAKLEDMRNRRKSLTDEFGSKKSRRKLDTMAKGVVEEANIAAGSSISQLVQSIAQKDGMMTVAEAEAKLRMSERRNVPPLNPDAKVPEDVYPIDRIIFLEDWQLLDYDAKDLMCAREHKGVWERISKHYPSYVQSFLNELGSKGVKTKQKADMLVYLTHLLRFYCAPPSLSFKRKVRQGRRNGEEVGEEEGGNASEFVLTSSDPTTVASLLHIPRQLVEKFISLYSVRVGGEGDNSSSLRREKKHINLLICTICVLALHVNDFSLNPESLAKDLKLALTALLPYFRELGCKVTKKEKKSKEHAGVYDVSLEIPLTFVKQLRGRKK